MGESFLYKKVRGAMIWIIISAAVAAAAVGIITAVFAVIIAGSMME